MPASEINAFHCRMDEINPECLKLGLELTRALKRKAPGGRASESVKTTARRRGVVDGWVWARAPEKRPTPTPDGPIEDWMGRYFFDWIRLDLATRESVPSWVFRNTKPTDESDPFWQQLQGERGPVREGRARVFIELLRIADGSTTYEDAKEAYDYTFHPRPRSPHTEPADLNDSFHTDDQIPWSGALPEPLRALQLERMAAEQRECGGVAC